MSFKLNQLMSNFQKMYKDFCNNIICIIYFFIYKILYNLHFM